MDEMDPFEARLVFGNMLDNLSGAQPTIDWVSGFMIKNEGMADSLLDYMMERLEDISVPSRINLLFIIEAVLVSSTRSRSSVWPDLLKKYIVDVIKAVIPENATGDGNVPPARKVVIGFRRKEYFDKRTIEEMEKMFTNRVGGNTPEAGLNHQEILKRIEEDRERHKRHKEDFWLRPSGELPEDELSSYWETTSDLNTADWQEIIEENNLYKQEKQWIEMAKNSV